MLTGEDREWIEKILAKALDSVQRATGQDQERFVTSIEESIKRFVTKEDLERFATSIEVSLKRFATKEDLERFATKEDLERFATKEDLERFATKEDLERFATKEDLERIETKLLTEFHKWSSPVEQRMRTHAAAMRALDLEIEAVQDRVNRLEGR